MSVTVRLILARRIKQQDKIKELNTKEGLINIASTTGLCMLLALPWSTGVTVAFALLRHVKVVAPEH